MDEAEKAFNEIKKLLACPPVLKAPTPDNRRCGWYFTPKERRQISYWISFKKTPQISKEFWHHRVRINQIISEHSRFHATFMQ